MPRAAQVQGSICLPQLHRIWLRRTGSSRDICWKPPEPESPWDSPPYIGFTWQSFGCGGAARVSSVSRAQYYPMSDQSQPQLLQNRPATARAEPRVMLGVLWEGRYKEGKHFWVVSYPPRDERSSHRIMLRDISYQHPLHSKHSILISLNFISVILYWSLGRSFYRTFFLSR